MPELLTQELTINSGLPWQIVILRISGAVLLAGVIGFEREYKDRPAGLRTHMLTSMASCVFCLVMLALVYQAGTLGEHVRVDPLRIVGAVTQGVAFLAAGIVVFSKGEVRGLTTGASMWLAAALGLACGLGLWVIAAFTTVLSLFIIRVLKVGENEFLQQGERKDRGP